ncbi:MAG: hypothetical protein ACTIJ9_00865 [Aequorivita sp.]
MKNILFICLIALATNTLMAQKGMPKLDIYKTTININEKALAFGLTEAEFETIKDEAYANPEFVEGNIYQGENLIKSEVPMRYNAYADEIEIKKSPYDENYSALTKNPDIFVKMGNDLYLFVPFEGSNAKGGYFNVLNDGKTYDLYKKVTSTYNEPKKAQTTYGRDTPPGFSKSVVYYLVEDGSFMEMPNRKSKILKMMNEKKSEMKTFIKENKLDLDKEGDLIKAVKHFDSLL